MEYACNTRRLVELLTVNKCQVQRVLIHVYKVMKRLMRGGPKRGPVMSGTHIHYQTFPRVEHQHTVDTDYL